MTGRRIALLHFTAPPAIGGVEALLRVQAEALHEGGHEVTVVAGAGEPSHVYRLVIIPEIHPDSPTVRTALAEKYPDPCHPLVQRIAAHLTPILSGQDQIWIHNALTVTLNPFLTVALETLMEDLPSMRWIAFCHDISSVSRYVVAPPSDVCLRYEAWKTDLRFVALSEARRTEVAAVLGIPACEIAVIPPPLDIFAWLQIGEEARQIADTTTMMDRDLTLLVPSKLLPHKRIESALEVLAKLRRAGVNALMLVTAAPSPHEPGVSRRVARELQALAGRLGVDEHFCLVAETLGRTPELRTVRNLMNLCDVVFLPSAEEGYGTPINEAIALRAPVVCSDIPAFREAAGDYATFVTVDNTGAVVDQMIRLAHLPAVMQRHKVMRSAERFRSAILCLARDV